MEVQFKEESCPCLNTAVREIQNLEQTQELKLTDGMPDIGRVLGAWGQTLLRSKEWRGRSIGFSGGVMIWVLYLPEDGTKVRCLESWIPFQMQWELPENVPEGSIRIRSLLRFVDARSVSARKIMVRCGISALAEACCPMEGKWYTPENAPDTVQLLRRKYPLRLPKESGEKAFSVEEELTLPASAPQPEKLLYHCVNPQITDWKLLGDKVLFRGNLNLHMLYISEEGQLHSWDFELPFSQFSELGQEFSPEGSADIWIEPTNLELELLDEGQLRLKAGLTAQYLVDDVQLLELVEDAYSPNGKTAAQLEQLTMPTILERRQQNLYGEQKLPEDAAITVDTQLLPAFPGQSWQTQGVTLIPSGVLQLLYYDQEGALQRADLRWEEKMELPAAENVRLFAIPMPAPVEAPMSGSMTAKLEIPFALTTEGKQGIPMITALSVEQDRGNKAERPSLILRRAAEGGLWELAKTSGSTVDAIRQVNQLAEDPVPGQMLLIPVL